MNPQFISDKEKNDFLLLSKTIEAENYEPALALAKAGLVEYPHNAAVYHNQIGALIFITNSDYWSATQHYQKALELGFDHDCCEYNTWEAAVDAHNSLIDSESGYCAVVKVETGEFMYDATTLLNKYRELFPKGEHIAEIEEYLYVYEVISAYGEQEIDAEKIRTAYQTAGFSDKKEFLEEMLAIYASKNEA